MPAATSAVMEELTLRSYKKEEDDRESLNFVHIGIGKNNKLGSKKWEKFSSDYLES